jgi:hypothetical protein
MTLRVAGVLSLLVVLCACDIKVNPQGEVSLNINEGGRAEDEWTRQYRLSPGGRLEIVNVAGSIEARAATGSDVTVRAVRTVRSRSDEAARDALGNIQMLEEVAPGRVRVEAKADQNPPPGSGAPRSQIAIEYHLGVPPGLEVVLKTEHGAVNLENVQGTLSVSSTNGGINGRGLSGSLKAATVNGGIQVDLAAVTGDVELVTINGGVRVELPADVDAVIDARAVNGGVSIDERLPLTATERARLHVAGRLNDGGPQISLRTTNGGVRVTTRGGRGPGDADVVGPELRSRRPPEPPSPPPPPAP